ncbi:UNVERIFIED_CONTAM: hypothetical protein GTU68_052835 [Idotea baltica]|nr:hypothetical protein [Idotea baltica]
MLYHNLEVSVQRFIQKNQFMIFLLIQRF